MNPRKFPRTTLEAFGCDASNSDPVSGPYVEHHSPLKFVVVVILVLFAVVVSFRLYAGGIDDNRSEWARSDLMQVDQRDDAHRKKATTKCLEKRGQGAAVLFDENDVVSGCGPRRFR